MTIARRRDARMGRGSQDNLEHVLKEYCFNYFNVARPHQGIGQRLPTAQVVKARTDAASVIAVPVLGALHHDYRAAA